MLRYSLYMHIFPNGKKYIGITRQKPERRWQKGIGYKEQRYMFNAIVKYGWNNIKHLILFANLSEEEAKEMEIKLIKQHKSNQRKYGYNISKGGETYRENFKPRRGKEHPNSKKIKQFDICGNLINVFDSQSEASKILGINRKGITKNCLGQSKTYKGYIFEYYDGNYVKPKKYKQGKHPNHRKRKIAEIDNKGNIIKKYNSIKEASIENNINASGINKCCNGMLKTYHQRRWCYLVEMD